MLSVILKILGVLGIILLILLAFIIILLLLVLFMPIAYRIRANRTRKDDDFETDARVTARWMFGLVRAEYKYPDPGVFKVKVLFFTVYRSDKVSDVEAQEEAEDEALTDDHKEDKTSMENKSEADAVPAESIKPNQETSLSNQENGEQISTSHKGILTKIQYKFWNTYDKIKSIIDKIKEIYHNFTYYKDVLTCEDTKALLKQICIRLGKILKKLRPRKLRVDMTIGTGAPDTTGYLYAVYGMFCSYLGKHVNITPDFEQAIIEGRLYAAGFTTVFNILWNAFLIIKDKRLWELKDKLERNKPK